MEEWREMQDGLTSGDVRFGCDGIELLRGRTQHFYTYLYPYVQKINTYSSRWCGTMLDTHVREKRR